MKKIANEVMKDEELDSVAGGTIAETVKKIRCENNLSITYL